MADIDYETVIRFARGLSNGMTRDDFVENRMLTTPNDELALQEAEKNVEMWARTTPEAEVGVASTFPQELWDKLVAEGIC